MFNVGQIFRPSHFRVRLRGKYQTDGLANQLARSSVIRHQESTAANLGKRTPDNVDAERLRSLNGPESLAVKCPLDEFAVRRFLNGISHGLRGDGRAGLPSSFNGSRD